ncbi:MAG: ribosome biogenesis GTPase Der [Mailhella sp.]|nr:ribosome biogenesis GTPase Der [Mailhella sp.]
MHKAALVGRPNVGKSTLFNRLIRSNRAITHDRPGVTRDRMEGIVSGRGHRPYMLIDTGGVTLDSHAAVAGGQGGTRGFEAEILEQAREAMLESSALCLVVDGKEGLTPFDEHLATYIRKLGKPVLLAVNKVDGIEKEDELMAEFHVLGFPMVAVSAEHGVQVRYLEELLSDLMPEEPAGDEAAAYPETQEGTDAGSAAPSAAAQGEKAALKLCMLGRPNAGKSSLVNAFIGSARMIVSDIAGTTRDSVDVPFVLDERRYVFVDTAGVRRRTRVTDSVERFSVNSSLKSTTKADVTLMVIDSLDGLTAQDKRLIELLDERKTPFMILLNKMDLVPAPQRRKVLADFREALTFCPHVPIISVSAKTRYGLRDVLPVAEQIKAECAVRIGTGLLNRSLEEVVAKHQPPVVKRVRPKFFYMTQAESMPPTFVFFVNDADRVGETYVRYLERSLRKLFSIEHAPMRLHLRSSHKKDADARSAAPAEAKEQEEQAAPAAKEPVRTPGRAKAVPKSRTTLKAALRNPNSPQSRALKKALRKKEKQR